MLKFVDAFVLLFDQLVCHYADCSVPCVYFGASCECLPSFLELLFQAGDCAFVRFDGGILRLKAVILQLPAFDGAISLDFGDFQEL